MPQSETPRADSLLAMARGCGWPVFFEPSIKIRCGAILTDRALVGVCRDDAPPRLRDSVLRLAARLGMPAGMQSRLDLAFARAELIWFGVEADGANVIHKAYLEIPQGDPRPGAKPQPAFLAWKWRSNAPGVATEAAYRRLHASDGSKLLEALSGYPEPDPARDVLRRALRTAPARDLVLLDVQEPGSPRRSYDLNVYAAGLRVHDVGPCLSRALRRLDAPTAVLDRIASSRLGHVSAGVARDGAPFLTLYHGMRLIAPTERQMEGASG